jgi:hypothetical protein
MTIGQSRHRLGRLRAALDRIPQADEVVDRPPRHVGEHRVERQAIPVDVREDGDAHGGTP